MKPYELIMEVTSCPVCGSKERYIEKLAKEELELKHMLPGGVPSLTVIEGNVKDPRALSSLPLGTTFPCYAVITDVCLGYPNKPCGTIYATQIYQAEGEIKPNILLPGQEGGGPKFPGPNNPEHN